MVFDLFYASFWIFLIFYGVSSNRVFKNNLDLNKLTAYGFLIKALMTISLMIVFERIIPSSNIFIDTEGYMADTAYLYDVFWQSPISYFKFMTGIGDTEELIAQYLPNTYLWKPGLGLYNDSKNVLRFNSVIYFISQGNVFIHVIFMCLFSTLGIRLIVLSFKNFVSAYKLLFFVLLFMIPSLFVSSGAVLKEPFMIFGIGLFLYPLLSQDRGKLKWIGFTFGLLFLLTIKPYVILILLVSISFFIFSKKVLSRKPWVSLIVFVLFSIVFFLSVKPIRVKTVEYISKKQLDMERMAKGGLYVYDIINANEEEVRFTYFEISKLHTLKIENDSVRIIAPVVAKVSTDNPWEDFKDVGMEPSMKKWEIYVYVPNKANSYFYATPIRNSLRMFILTAPEAFINGLLRPFPWNEGSAYKYPALFEVFFCVGIFVFALFNRIKTTVFENRILGSLALFSVATLLLVGYTTPVVGALVRYRVPAFIALIIFSFIILKIPEKWKKQIQ